MITIENEFINVKISIPSREVKDLILNISNTLNNLSNNNKSEPILITQKPPNELLTVSEVAKILKVNVNYVYSLIKKGHIPALKLGSLKITSYDLEKFINDSIGKDFSDLNNIKELK